jgi:glyceraldehyde 3-phosphate dehydrogenase
MPLRIAINGFGRIGRCLARLIFARGDELELAAVNSRADSRTDVHLFRYDSVHGPFPGTVEAGPDESLIVNGREVRVLRLADPDRLPWKELGVDMVFESTGAFRDRLSNEGHLRAGAQKVIVAAPGKDLDATLVYGVNHRDYDPKRHHVVSNASCTTNCLAPVVKVLNDNFGIDYGMMNTVHSYTMDQRLLDGSHLDLRRARAAGLSMVPTSTGAVRAVTQVLPEMAGRLEGLAVRVPTANVSLIDFAATVRRDTSKEAVNQAFAAAAAGFLQGVLHLTFEPLVSIDYKGSPYSTVVDGDLTTVLGGRLVKVMAWYDNEWGFSNRMLDLALYMGRQAA